jgi:hypothetical protein
VQPLEYSVPLSNGDTDSVSEQYLVQFSISDPISYTNVFKHPVTFDDPDADCIADKLSYVDFVADAVRVTVADPLTDCHSNAIAIAEPDCFEYSDAFTNANVI